MASVGIGVGSGGTVQGTIGVAQQLSAPTQEANMKRAYEALGITCPTSVPNMGGGFPRAPVRMPAPRPPPLTDVVPQQQTQSVQSLFSHQPQPDMQTQQQQQQPQQQTQTQQQQQQQQLVRLVPFEIHL